MTITVVIQIIKLIIIGYLFGSIPVGYIYSKLHGVDILNFGSKNPGSTNVGRALGKKHGRIVFFLDALKIAIPLIIYIYYKEEKFLHFVSVREFVDFQSVMNEHILQMNLYKIYFGLGGIIGHNFPIFLKFKGGKGITCTMATIFIFCIPYSLILFLIYKIVSKITKIVSIGSLVALTSLFVSSIVLTILYIYPFDFYKSYLVLPGILIMWILGVVKHKDNINRLLKKEELKME